MIKVCHMTSVHEWMDERIFLKQCVSLANHGFDVTLVAQGDTFDENGVHIVGIGNLPKSRIKRIYKTTNQVYKKALAVDADIYHFHDPELLPYGLKLKKHGKKVIFDSHEDVSEQIKNKTYLPAIFRTSFSFIYKKYEKYVCSRLDALVTVSEYIKNKLAVVNHNVVILSNYPLKEEFLREKIDDYSKRKSYVCYVGGITNIRGIHFMVDAVNKTQANFILAGPVDDEYLKLLKGLQGWKKTKFYGKVNREKVGEIYAESMIGLVTFLPVPNHMDPRSNKMYEYMAAGLPFIYSKFPMWEDMINEIECGIAVNPEDPDEIACAINYLINNKEVAKKMGENGIKAIIEKFNWNIEEQKLFNLYEHLLEN